LSPVHSKAYGSEKEIVPKAVAFDDNDERDLYIFGLYDGGLYKYGGKDAKSISKHQLGSQIGNASVDIDRKICVVDNVFNGFDVYKMDSGNFVKTLITKEAEKTYPKGVAFADKSHLIVGGSDHGVAYIFERKTGKVLKRLKHAKKGGVETIGVRSSFNILPPFNNSVWQVQDTEDGVVLIATASTSMSSGTIMLWEWKSTRDTGRREDVGEGWTVRSVFEFFVKVVIVLAAMTYFLGFIQRLAQQWLASKVAKEVEKAGAKEVVNKSGLASLVFGQWNRDL
ncbi:hypothetical protein BDZ97DRAFT_1929269, partial [Flammula alnicola]